MIEFTDMILQSNISASDITNMYAYSQRQYNNEN